MKRLPAWIRKSRLARRGLVAAPKPQMSPSHMSRIKLTGRRSEAVARQAGLPAPSTQAKPGRRTGIAPANLQQHLESAANAGAKGQAQYHTGAEWARVLALALPQYRPVLVDLECGSGQLLAGASAPSTRYLLGSDIEQISAASKQGEDGRLPPRFVHADITKFFSLLGTVDFAADCFVLNPPWDLHWYRDRLAALANSDCPAVDLAFNAYDPRLSKDTIDSTIASLCMALDRCSPYGEGLLIANEATLQRLIFGQNAPHAALAAHVWAHLTIPGNICQPDSPNLGLANSAIGNSQFHTGILYFARSHTQGSSRDLNVTDIKAAQTACFELGRARLSLRRGPVIRSYEGGHTADTVESWDAAREEWNATQAARPVVNWNLWLDTDGTIKTNLSLFDQASGRVKKEQYLRLFALNGKHPMQLILQKAERRELERAVLSSTSPWRVAPAVVDAVRQALEEYNAIRAPIVPLTKIQRLGYLDDNDDILCLKDLSLRFRAGVRYTMRTETFRIRRWGTKLNLTGERDEVEWEGSELALFIKDGEGIERLFMEERLKGHDVRLSIQNEGEPSPIEFNLQQLVEHFEIPEVPDVSQTRPEEYSKMLERLDLIEQIVNN
jgi:predicted RNA methylase